MPTYTTITNKRQDAGIAAKLAKTNARLASKIPPETPWTEAQQFENMVQNGLKSWADEVDEDERRAFKLAEKYDGATLAKKQQIREILR